MSRKEPSVHKNKIKSLYHQGEIREAFNACRRFCENNPQDAEGWFILGALHGKLNNYADAVLCLRNSLNLAPQVPNTHYNLGIALINQSKYIEAEKAFRTVLNMAPGHPSAPGALAALLWDQGRYQESEQCLRQALVYNPRNAEALAALAHLLSRKGSRQEAISTCEQAYLLSHRDSMRILKALALPAINESVEDIHKLRGEMLNAIQDLLEIPLSVNNLEDELATNNFFLAYQGANDLDIQVKTAQLLLHACPSLGYVSPGCSTALARKPDKRIRVGFISRFFKNHSIGKTSSGLIEKLDRKHFEVIVFTFNEADDQLSRTISGHADKVIVIPAKLDIARRLIEKESIDILFYQDIGMDHFTYYLAFSRLAPIQCTTFGHPVTTGILNMDYFISTDYYEPESAQAHYSEQLVLLKDVASCAYYYRPELPEVLLCRSDYGLREEDHIYICPQALFKLHPEFDAIMAGILREDPKGRIVLIEDINQTWRDALEKRFQDYMPDVADRIQFVPRQGNKEFTNLLAVADVILDPIHFGGQNTTHEGLSAGTPIVTWPGEFQRGRHAYGFYRKMDFLDCVARDHADYISIAVKLANDSSFRSLVVGKIVEQRHMVWEETRVVREFERVFMEMCKKAGMQTN